MTRDDRCGGGPEHTDQSQKIEALHDAATELMTCHTEEAVYERTVAAAERILAFDVCCTMAFEDGMLRPTALSSGAPADGARPMEPDEGDAGRTFQTGEARITADTAEADVAEPAKDTYRSGMTVPIGDVGVFQAVSSDPEDFDRTDLDITEMLTAYTQAAIDRLRFDEVLHEEHERFRSLFELSTDCISESTLTGDQAIVRQVNPAFEAVFGYDESEIVGEPLDDFVTPEDAKAEGYELNRRSVEEGQFEQEVTRMTADGPREFLLRSIPFELGEEVRCFAVYTDITERNRAKRRFRAFTEHSSDVITVLEADGTIDYASPSIERVLGYGPDSLVGENAFEYVHPDDRQAVMSAFEDAVSDPDIQPTVEYRFRHADGGWRTFESIGTNRLSDPAVEGFVVNSRDLTERKERLRILEELPGAAAKLREADDAATVSAVTVETIDDVLELPISAVWLHDPTEGVLRPAAASEESAALFGELPTYAAEDESLSWQAFETGDFEVYDDIRQEAATHNPETAIRSEIVLPLGQFGVINVGTTERAAFSDVDVYFTRILAATVHSALERIDHERSLRRRRDELRRQNEQLEEFASLVSHDLRNPLNVAQGYAQLVAGADTLEAAAEYAGEIEASLRRMDTIIGDVLALARQGREVRDPEVVDLAAVARTAWGSVETGDATLEVAEDATLLADQSRLAQLFENLIRNAMEHGEADRVHVGTLAATDDRAAGFYLEDDGSGIPPDLREHAFEKSVSTAAEGTGFGLAIVDGIAEGHGWSVALAEGGEGGARFEFTGADLV